MREATNQQRLFVDEYLKLRKKNQTQAAINAGYSPKSASAQSSQLLKNPKVLEYLKMRESQLTEDLREKFIFDALEARNVMRDIMLNKKSSDRDRLSAAKDFLDRAGFKPVEKTNISGDLNVTNEYETMSDEELDQLVNRYVETIKD